MASAVTLRRLELVLKARGRGRFDAFFVGTQIVAASEQAITAAARVLHRMGYADEFLLVARHDGADHHAIFGALGKWRRLRVREGRGAPRYVRWEPFPSRRVRGEEREIAPGVIGGSLHDFGASSRRPGPITPVRTTATPSARSVG
jgi:hypothetical protein